MSNVRLADIAKKMNTSVVTVSNALADRGGVSAELKEEIRRAADEMGYKRRIKKKNVTHGDNGSSRGKRIVVLVSMSSIEKYTSFYWEMYQRMVLKAANLGYITALEMISNGTEQGLIMPKIINIHQTEGIVILGMLSERYLTSLIAATNIPIVFMDFDVESLPCDTVMSNGYAGEYAMTRYLLSLGHTKVGYVGNIFANNNIMDRYMGFCKALAEAGIKPREDWILSDRNTYTGKAEVIMLPEEMPTAFVCCSDYSAGLLASELIFEGYSIPEDISIVSYDDYLANGVMKGRLTTCAVDMDSMAELTLDFLGERMRGVGDPKRVAMIDGHIVIRTSARQI